MPKIEEKQVVINEIKDKLSRAKSVVLVSARGLTVEQDTLLRKTLREAGVDYKVYKNTMMTLAIKDSGFESLERYLAGPTAVAISYTEATLAASLLDKQMKAMPKLVFKGGVVDSVAYDAVGVKTIAGIPSREELLSRLLGSFKSPMASFARLINAIAEKDGGGAETSETA